MYFVEFIVEVVDASENAARRFHYFVLVYKYTFIWESAIIIGHALLCYLRYHEMLLVFGVLQLEFIKSMCYN